MRATDPLPIDASRLDADAFVGDVITVPAVTPLITAARARGCGTQIGTGMFAAVGAHIVDFLLASGPLSMGPRTSGA
jgi:shikimate dehydrogenase